MEVNITTHVLGSVTASSLNVGTLAVVIEDLATCTAGDLVTAVHAPGRSTPMAVNLTAAIAISTDTAANLRVRMLTPAEVVILKPSPA